MNLNIDPFEEGYEAGQRGDDHNPYSPESPKHGEWEQGFEAGAYASIEERDDYSEDGEFQ